MLPAVRRYRSIRVAGLLHRVPLLPRLRTFVLIWPHSFEIAAALPSLPLSPPSLSLPSKPPPRPPPPAQSRRLIPTPRRAQCRLRLGHGLRLPPTHWASKARHLALGALFMSPRRRWPRSPRLPLGVGHSPRGRQARLRSASMPMPRCDPPRPPRMRAPIIIRAVAVNSPQVSRRQPAW